MYLIKQIPEDFCVTERTSVQPLAHGAYRYFWLGKRNRTTLDALRAVAAALRIPAQSLGYAGNKDKRAVTRQLCSAFHVSRDRIERVRLDGIGLEFYGSGDAPVSLGDLAGNSFVVTVRNLDEAMVRNLDDAGAEKLAGSAETRMPAGAIRAQARALQVINYFDEQRFSESNIRVGKLLVLKQFKEAVALLMQHGQDGALLEKHLKACPHDYVGALRLLPRKILLLLVHSYQSWLFNETAAMLVKGETDACVEVPYRFGAFVFPLEPVQNVMVPIPGFGTEFDGSAAAGIVQALLVKEGVTLRDFIIRQLPEAAAEGSSRALAVAVEGLHAVFGDDELNAGRKKATLSFTLPKGSYATVAVKRLFAVGGGSPASS